MQMKKNKLSVARFFASCLFLLLIFTLLNANSPVKPNASMQFADLSEVYCSSENDFVNSIFKCRNFEWSVIDWQNNIFALVPPTVSSISPSMPQTSVTDQNIVVNGNNFVSGLTVTVTFPNGGTGTLSGSQIQNVTSSSFFMRITLNATGTWSIRVNNPNGEQSGQFSFNVVTAQTPTISSISPSSPTVSNSDQNVNVSGSNFQSGMTVTIFFPGGGSGTLSGSQLQNVTPTSFRMVVTLNIVGTYGIRINNPSGRQSSTFNFQTQAATPSISSISPSGVCAQNGDRNFTVNGGNFVSGLTVTIFFPGGGSTTLSGSQIQNVTSSSFTMTVTLNVIGTYNFRVNNPSGAQSSNFPYATQNCNPVINSISPASPTVSNSNQNVNVSGSNFQSGLTVTVFFPNNGGSTTLSGSQIQNVTSTSFTMVITLNIVGNYGIRVNNPNGNQSNIFNFNTQAAPPSISSVSPATPCVRNIDQSITVNGNNFVSSLTVTVTFPNGQTGTLSGSQIQNVTSTSFTMLITLADPGNYSIRVYNPSGAQSNNFQMPTQNCLLVSGTNPQSPTQSNIDQNVIVSGSGFTANLTVIVTLPNGTTTTLSGTQILSVTSASFTMKITLNATGTWRIKVRNPNGDLSNTHSFNVQTPAAPAVTSINPTSPTASGVDQNITVNGTNFQLGLTVTVTFPNGGTAVLSGTQIQNVTAASFTMRITLGNAGNWNLRVNNPNGGQSNTLPFTVQSSVQPPVIFSINPTAPIARGTDQDVTIIGTNFQQNLTVSITFPAGGGTTLSGTQIQNVTATSFIMRATLNAAGGWTIRVNNPDGGPSSVYSFNVSAGANNPVINSINPSAPVTNGADQNVIVNGSNFQNGLKVNVTFPSGGMATLQGTGQIQNVTSTSFLMRITLNGTGTWSIRVVNPDNSQSQQFAFTVQASGPPPTGLPTSVLSPVIGPIKVTTTNQGINDGKWEFNQHSTGFHTPTGGISLSNDRYAWDINLYTPTSGNADAGKTVFAVADGQVVSYVGTLPGGGPGAVLIAHPNAANPVWFSGYLHMTNVRVTVNQLVNATTVIGEIGSVGANNDHLHFVVYSGENTRGNLRSFNTTIVERSTNSTNLPTITGLIPDTVNQSSEPELITISGTNFHANSIVVVERPDGVSVTLTPQSVSVAHNESRILEVTSSSITALISVGISGTHTVSVINPSTNSSIGASELISFALSQSSNLNVNARPRRTPVILIPGIMGSRIAKSNGDELFPYYPHWTDFATQANQRHIQLKDNVGDGRPMEQRAVVATDILRYYAYGAFGQTYYLNLIGRLKNIGYIEYDAVDRPNRRTMNGCDMNQTNADLFLFPYDWRNKNEQSANDLKDFIGCIKRLYNAQNDPNFKVQIIAHSMGGLVARRYILDGVYGSAPYTHHVERMITLGTPWLGAPKAILPIYNGEFEGVNSLIDKNILKEVGRFMPGPHELLPSRVYVNELGDQTLPPDPGDYPFGERNWDIDQSGRWESIYTFGRFENWTNQLRPSPISPIQPGTNTDLFHNKLFAGRNLQDNWTTDSTGVTYYNFTGLANNSTIGSLVATSVWQGNQIKSELKIEYTRGDGTVPAISSSRQSARGNYLGPATPKVFLNVQHLELPNDYRVYLSIKCVLETPNPNTCINQLNGVYTPAQATQIVDEPVYILKISGSQSILISDSFGNTTDPLSTSHDEGVASISTTVTGNDYLSAVFPSEQNYRIVIRTSLTPISITLTKNTGETTNQAIRYIDLLLPPNVLALLELTPQGVTILKYDSNGDGTFDTQVNPTINVTGTQAQDIEPPQIVVNETVQNGSSRIVLEATDTGTGVQRIMYSLNGTTFQQYSNPLTLNPQQTPRIYAFADDNVANRSGLVTHNLLTSNAGFSVSGPSVATPGSQIAAMWNAPTGRPTDDWIGLFRVGALNSAYISKQYTSGQTSGSLNFNVPNQPGTYEFRYLINDGFSSLAVSNSIIVSSSTRVQFDFDGDGKTDYGVFRPSGGAWYLQNSTSGFFATQFGISTDKLTPADFDGDGKTDIAVFRDGTWYLQRSQQGFTGVQFGVSSDIPVPADYDGDGKADVAVFRPSNGTWYLLRSQLGFTGIQFGISTDKPVAADFDGDGKADLAVYRDGTWYLLQSQLGFTGIQFGIAGDKRVPGDYDGDGKADLAVFRNGFWYLLRSQLGFTGVQFGAANDKTAVGDYDGDGKADVAVWRSTDGAFYVLQSQAGFVGFQFGADGDTPVASAFVPQ
jgi:hypothetical protein